MMTIENRPVLGGPLTPVYIAAARDGAITITNADGQEIQVDIVGIGVPVGDPIVGQVVIAVTGTAVRLSAVSVPLPTSSVLVYALTGNAATGGVVGTTGVANTVDGTGDGYILENGQSVVIMTDDLNSVWVNGTAGDIFTYSAG